MFGGNGNTRTAVTETTVTCIASMKLGSKLWSEAIVKSEIANEWERVKQVCALKFPHSPVVGKIKWKIKQKANEKTKLYILLL